MMRLELEKKANRLLVVSNAIENIPIDLWKIVDHLNASVEKMPPGIPIEGLTVRTGKQKTIYIDMKAHLARRRFTAAHELAHIALDHKGCIHECMKNQRIYNWQEKEAEYMAGAILMPRLEFLATFRFFQDFKKTADRFRVSRTAARVRYDVLTGELWRWDQGVA